MADDADDANDMAERFTPSEWDFLQKTVQWWMGGDPEDSRADRARRLVAIEKDVSDFIDGRRFWTRARSKGKWFLVQCAAFLTAAEALNGLWELFSKLRGHK